MSEILSKELHAANLPSDEASLGELIEFAHSFNGYAHWGSQERCAEVANSKDHSSIDNLRTCLFFETRRWRHFGTDPDPEAENYWRSLIAKIRQLVQNG